MPLASDCLQRNIRHLNDQKKGCHFSHITHLSHCDRLWSDRFDRFFTLGFSLLAACLVLLIF
jgi:hypothetical protein